MTLRLRITLAAGIIISLFLAGRFGSSLRLASFLPGTPAPVADDGTVLVDHAVDGDTIELAGGQRVRLLGIDTPETVDPRKTVQCYGPEASSYTHAIVDGQRVRLVADTENTDRYGRLLRYVYLADGTFLNLQLVTQGYARAYPYKPNTAHADEIKAAQAQAKAAGLGLWSACK